MDNQSVNNGLHQASDGLDYNLPRVPKSVSDKLDEILALQDKTLNRQFTKSSDKRLKVFSIFSATILIILVAVIGLATVKPAEVKKPVYNSFNQPINEHFVIELNKKVLSASTDKITILPKTEGKWSVESGGILSTDRLVFTPSVKFKENTEYKVSNISVDKLIFGSEKVADVSFKTEPALGIKNEGFISKEDGSTISADYVFKLSLRYAQDLKLIISPETELESKLQDSTHVSWQPKTFLPQGQSIKIDVIDIKTSDVLATKNFIVANEPKITFNKPSNFNQGDTAQITFSEPIDKPSADSITFGLDGKGSWKSDTVYEFIPKSVSPGEKYSFSVKAGLRTKNGGILAQDYNGEFSTIGAVTVVGTSPSGSELSQASQIITFTFDQPVDHDSATQHFSVNAGNVESFSWQDNTLKAKVVNLGYQKTVVASVSAGVKNAGFGLPSTQSYSVRFSTEARVTKYNVPFYRQEHSATCAVASLRMILAYRGIKTGEMDILGKMGYNPTVMNKSTDPATWDDPNEMFVGSVDGSMTKGTAAGPDAPPVAKAAQAYGRGASYATGIGVNWIASQLSSGNLVVMFGATKYTNTYLTWLTPSGRIEKMHTSSHSRAVIGFKGEPSAPIGFWINDPMKYSTEYWSASQLQSNINLDAYRQAVTVQ